MSTTALIVLIFAIIMIARHRKDRNYLEERLAERENRFEPPAALPDNSHLEREIEELRDRIKVLERIATDANSTDARETRRIAEEIEALRDTQNS